MLKNNRQTLRTILPIGLAIVVLEVLGVLLSDTLSIWDRIDFTDNLYLTEDRFDWAITVLIILLVLLLSLSGKSRWALNIVYLYTIWFTIDLILSIALMITALAAYKQGPAADALLWDGMIIWLSNAVLFSLWYWLIDAGGPLVRGAAQAGRSDFVFPLQANSVAGWSGWQPNLFDYLFLSFTVSTAYSPTDTLFLSRRAKGLMMIQSTISLLTFAMVVARAVNIIA